ncbi:hypothetical protein GOBAR_DD02582 [Gossypium barbadense]|nr:hypothetical protein GOBAR_DD02582 [Gossypium barbadense]
MEGAPVNVNEFQELPRKALPKMYYDYYSGGAEDEYTLKQNVEAFQGITINLSTTVLGYKISAPILVAPSAKHKWAHPEGEVATARAAAACDTIMILSYRSTCTIEEVASSCNAVRFFQCYVQNTRGEIYIYANIVQRAERCGYKAIFLTIDSPRLGRKEKDIKNNIEANHPWIGQCGISKLEGSAFGDDGSNIEAFDANTAFDPLFLGRPNNLKLLIATFAGYRMVKIYYKLASSTQGTIKAVEVGVDGIVVSNHGARQLDYAPPTISVLEEVVGAVKGKVPVLFDGGIRRGTDVLKALALGAQAVLIGRLAVYGLAAKGEYGVKRVIEMLRDELELTMALSGCPTLNHISRKHIIPESVII